MGGHEKFMQKGTYAVAKYDKLVTHNFCLKP